MLPFIPSHFHMPSKSFGIQNDKTSTKKERRIILA